MSAASDALTWAKNNPGAEASAHLLSIIAEHELTILHLREVNKGHAKGIVTMRKRVRAARAETEALRKIEVRFTGSLGVGVMSLTAPEPPAGAGRHRSVLLPTTLPKEITRAMNARLPESDDEPEEYDIDDLPTSAGWP